MALWRISVKSTGTVNGVRLEKGMFVEMVTKTSSNPINTNPAETKPIIGQLFMSKYGIDMLKAGLVSPSHLKSEKIG